MRAALVSIFLLLALTPTATAVSATSDAVPSEWHACVTTWSDPIWVQVSPDGCAAIVVEDTCVVLAVVHFDDPKCGWKDHTLPGGIPPRPET